MVRIDILNEPEAEEDVAPPLGILTVQVRAGAALHNPEQEISWHVRCRRALL